MTPDTGHKKPSGIPRVVALLRAHPDYHFMAIEISQQAHIPHGSIHKTLDRALQAGEPLKKLSKGMWQYDPSKERIEPFHPDENDVSGELFFENIVVYSHQKEGLRGVILSGQKGDMITSTGHLIKWERLSEDTMQITLTSNRNHRPWSMDGLLILFDMLEKDGLILDECVCSRIEANRDYGYRVCEGVQATTLEVAKGQLIKVYNHDGKMRVEYASRTNTPITEILSWMQYASETIAVNKCYHAMLEYNARISSLEHDVHKGIPTLVRRIKELEK
jgi:hypothetical protein